MQYQLISIKLNSLFNILPGLLSHLLRVEDDVIFGLTNSGSTRCKCLISPGSNQSNSNVNFIIDLD